MAALADAPLVTTAAAVAAVVVALLSLGSWVVLAAALAVAAWDGVAAAALLASIVAVAARLGSTGLSTLAGVQAVIGPAVMTGPAPAAASAALCAAALLLVSPAGLMAVPFGLAAGLVMAGPAASGLTAFGVRALAAAGCIELAYALARLPSNLARWRPAAAGIAAVLSVVLALGGRPAGGRWELSASELGIGVASAAVAAGLTAVAIVVARRQVSGETPEWSSGGD